MPLLAMPRSRRLSVLNWNGDIGGLASFRVAALGADQRQLRTATLDHSSSVVSLYATSRHILGEMLSYTGSWRSFSRALMFMSRRGASRMLGSSPMCRFFTARLRQRMGSFCLDITCRLAFWTSFIFTGPRRTVLGLGSDFGSGGTPRTGRGQLLGLPRKGHAGSEAISLTLKVSGTSAADFGGPEPRLCEYPVGPAAMAGLWGLGLALLAMCCRRVAESRIGIGWRVGVDRRPPCSRSIPDGRCCGRATCNLILAGVRLARDAGCR
mmetsp:Transcript_45126/g.115441  ORF Transcript_45126/g.115441 Transcript_45126/m.115441 type:complete len:267 (-) Transcript_45126:393-1193(-)